MIASPMNKLNKVQPFLWFPAVVANGDTSLYGGWAGHFKTIWGNWGIYYKVLQYTVKTLLYKCWPEGWAAILLQWWPAITCNHHNTVCCRTHPAAHCSPAIVSIIILYGVGVSVIVIVCLLRDSNAAARRQSRRRLLHNPISRLIVKSSRTFV